MSIFDSIKHAFQPVAREIKDFNPAHVVQGIQQAIENPIRSRIPGHLSISDAVETVRIAEPDAIDVDLFAGFGVELGVELDMEFDMGITIENPVEKISALEAIIETPPETVHQLCDHLWGLVPSEVRVYEKNAGGRGGAGAGALVWRGRHGKASQVHRQARVAGKETPSVGKKWELCSKIRNRGEQQMILRDHLQRLEDAHEDPAHKADIAAIAEAIRAVRIDDAVHFATTLDGSGTSWTFCGKEHEPFYAYRGQPTNIRASQCVPKCDAVTPYDLRYLPKPLRTKDEVTCPACLVFMRRVVPVM